MASEQQYPYDSPGLSGAKKQRTKKQQSPATISELQVVASGDRGDVVAAGCTERRRRVGFFLTYDIVDNILSRLPVRALARFRCVCKRWMSLTCDPAFIASQYKIAKDQVLQLLSKRFVDNRIMYYELSAAAAGLGQDQLIVQEISFVVNNLKQNYNPSWSISNSVHGLVCVFMEKSRPSDGLAYLVNPITREIAKLPRRTLPEDFGEHSVLLGFNSKRGEYTVAWLSSSFKSKCTRCEVLTFGRNIRFDRWTNMQANLVRKRIRSAAKSKYAWKYAGLVGVGFWNLGKAIHIDGMFYWLARETGTWVSKFLTLDTNAGHKFGTKPVPPSIDKDEQYHLLEMCGRLCALMTTFDDQVLIDIWTLDDHDKWTWSKTHSINRAEIPPICGSSWFKRPTIVGLITDDQNKLLFTFFTLGALIDCTIGPLYCYDLLAKTFTKYSDQIYIGLQVHAESLLSPTKVLSGNY